ncbi:MAG TPA: serine/threonine-protein kinase [Polyangia bacterium]|nr:serine/threonine-protein kinase [Polyangia bacterium]
MRGNQPLPDQFGRYELLGHIATGGMAELHLARAVAMEGFEKLVVVKRILPQLTADAEFVQMFLDEARIAATLQHPNIVQVYDIGVIDGDYFFSMEFLHGEDASRIVKRLAVQRRELPLEHAVHVIQGLCAGLHYAHEKTGFDGTPLHIVHRDISPQNVFVTYDGGVKLVDFGIAKASRRVAQTRYGTLKGKIRYMSPEQCRALPLDRRSDVFAVSILLWELTTGRRLFRGPSDFDVLKAIVETDALPPSCIKPDYPPDLERIVLRGLQRSPEQRYQTAQEMQADLEDFAREHKLAVSPIALSRFMRELFSDRLEAWQAARMNREALASHVKRVRTPSDDDIPGLDDAADAGVQMADSATLLFGERHQLGNVPTRVSRPARKARGLVLAGGFLAVAAAAAAITVPAVVRRHVEPDGTGASTSAGTPTEKAPPAPVAPAAVAPAPVAPAPVAPAPVAPAPVAPAPVRPAPAPPAQPRVPVAASVAPAPKRVAPAPAPAAAPAVPAPAPAAPAPTRAAPPRVAVAPKPVASPPRVQAPPPHAKPARRTRHVEPAAKPRPPERPPEPPAPIDYDAPLSP